MKDEFKLLVKETPKDSYKVIEYSSSKRTLEIKQKTLKKQHPNWEVLVIKQNYNVSWKETLWNQIHTMLIW